MNRHASVMTKDQLIEQFNAVAIDTEKLLKSVATAGGEQAVALRDSAEQSLASVKDRLRELQNTATERLETAARNPSIQGYADGVFWERNSLSNQKLGRGGPTVAADSQSYTVSIPAGKHTRKFVTTAK